MEVWPKRGGEGNSIRRNLYKPNKKPQPLVLVPLDGADAGSRCLGYTIVYPSSKMSDGDGKSVSNW